MRYSLHLKKHFAFLDKEKNAYVMNKKIVQFHLKSQLSFVCVLYCIVHF